MLQKLDDLNNFHKKKDPWGYSLNPDDLKRVEILLSEIPESKYMNVLDVGCGQGFVTSRLPGENIYGIDISTEAIKHANNRNIEQVNFIQGSIFDLNKMFKKKFDLIIITGVLYPQYIGDSSSLIYKIIDKLLSDGGFLITVHIDEWYSCQFPYLKLKQFYYPYRDYNHKLEIYGK